MKARGFRPTHGRNQQFLMNEYNAPPIERRLQIEAYRLDTETFRVYTDASELEKKGIFGLAFACVGNGGVIVRSKKYYNQGICGKNPFAEIAAVSFAIQELTDIKQSEYNDIEDAYILSDINWIDNYENSKWSRDPDKSDFIKSITANKRTFEKQFPDVQLSISYIGEDKRYNPFYKAAHNAARKILKD